MIAYIISSLGFILRNVCNKEFTNRFHGKQYDTFFNAICLTITCVISALMGGVQKPTGLVLLLALIFGADFILTVSLMLIAYKKGPMGMVNLILNMCAVVPMAIGLFLFHQKLTVCNIIGLALVFVILFLVWFDGESSKDKEAMRVYISPKIWLPVTLLVCFTNGCLSGIQSMVVQWCGDVSVHVFNFWAYLFGALIGWVLHLINKVKGVSFEEVKEKPVAFAVTSSACGLLASAGNILIMVAIVTIPSSIAYPLQSCLLTVSAYLIGLLYYKEARGRNGIWLVLLTLATIVLFNL